VKAALVALAGVSLVLAVTVGLLIGMHAHGQKAVVAQQSLSSPAPTSHQASSTSALTTVELGVVAANLACEYVDIAASYWVQAIVLHGVDVGVIKEDSTSNTRVYRGFHEDVHTALAQAATDDPRWAELKAVVLRSESAAIALWDRGGKTPSQAVDGAVGTDVDTAHGICAAAKSQLKTVAQTHNETAEAVLTSGGATETQVRNWQFWGG
jgi:hypothetical protein